MAEPSVHVAPQPQTPSHPVNRRIVPGLPRWELATLGLWFVVFSVLAEYFPRSGDDWFWGSQAGVDRLQHFFQGLNGRYAGNLVILGLVRSGPLIGIVVSAVVCLTLFLVLHIASSRTPLGYGLASALFLAMPRGVWREGVAWLSGFVNYVIAATVFLCFFAVAQAEWHGKLRAPSRVRLTLIALAAFVGQFFMEHVSVCICVIGVLLSVLYRRTNRVWPPYTLAWTIAAIVGLGVMLENPAYRRAASGGPGYQQVQVTSGPHALHKLAVKVLDYLPTQAVVSNIAFNAVLTIALVVLVVVSGRLRTRLGRLVVALSVGYLVISWTLSFLERDSRHVREYLRAWAMIAALLMLAAVVLAASSMVRSAERRWTVYAACASLVCMVGPLIVVNPIGPRCFFPTYMILLVLFSVVAAEVREQVPRVASRAVWMPVQLVSVGLATSFFVIYVSITHAVNHRLAEVRAAVRGGQATVQIVPLPHSYYVHNGDPFWSYLRSGFKAFYGFPNSLTVRLAPNPWLRVPGKASKPGP
jgi:hypothetical protein